MVTATRALRIVAADDSAVIRHMLTMLFETVAEHADASAQRIELCATVGDGVRCLDAVRDLRPDLLLLDLEMPRMSGMEVLDVLRRERPEMPVIMCSAHTARGAAETLEALARGAVDYVTKPTGSKNPMAAMASLSAQLLPKVAALTAKARHGAGSSVLRPSLLWPTRVGSVPAVEGLEVVGIGVSTGGPAALEGLLPKLGRGFAVPIVVVQHMPKLFTGVLAERLDKLCRGGVREATHGQELLPGEVWIAPGESHMEVVKDGAGRVRAALHQGPMEHHCRPAVDVMFRSLSRGFGRRALGLVLTGMGSDGLAGARAMVETGGTIWAQDEASSAVWGMPGRVVEEGLASAVLPIGMIASALGAHVRDARLAVAS